MLNIGMAWHSNTFGCISHHLHIALDGSIEMLARTKSLGKIRLEVFIGREKLSLFKVAEEDYWYKTD